MELTKVYEKREDGEKFNTIRKTYEIGKYEVFVTEYEVKRKDQDNKLYINVRKVNWQDKIPEIECYEDWMTGKNKKFKLQTTAYGALSPDEIREMIKGYEEALKVAEELQRVFGN